jgi:hypothetical protein
MAMGFAFAVAVAVVLAFVVALASAHRRCAPFATQTGYRALCSKVLALILLVFGLFCTSWPSNL